MQVLRAGIESHHAKMQFAYIFACFALAYLAIFRWNSAVTYTGVASFALLVLIALVISIAAARFKKQLIGRQTVLVQLTPPAAVFGISVVFATLAVDPTGGLALVYRGLIVSWALWLGVLRVGAVLSV
jgi:hypothetical protein